MPALRCSFCALNFPKDPSRFKECPKCEQETSLITNARAMPDEEAQSILNHSAFDIFYEKWDAQKGPLEARGC